MIERYTPRKLVKAIRNPEMLRREGTRLLTGLLNGYRQGEGIDVMSEDWDNLIILDACRYDYFKRVHDFDGELKRVTSKGKSSWQFIEQNFQGRKLHDTVYITSNAFFDDIDQDVFFTIKSVLENKTEYGMGWEVGINQVHPERVVELAYEVHETYPNKRMIIHFLQPHQPFIGEKADEIRAKVPEGAVPDDNYDNFKPDHIHYHLSRDYVTVEEFREAYKETLEFVLEYAEELLSTLGGKSVITADHGELLGERIFGRERYSHNSKWECPELREVPWFVVEADERRQVESDDPIGFDELDAKAREEHMKALGYR